MKVETSMVEQISRASNKWRKSVAVTEARKEKVMDLLRLHQKIQQGKMAKAEGKNNV